jgi:hypothetical protein
VKNPIILLILLAACSAERNDASRPVVRDSAGVAIVENGLPTEALERPVDSTPKLTIGGAVGGADYDLNQIRGAVRLSDGRIVVADNSLGVNFYDSTGTFLKRAGRKGKGPGEFEQMMSLWVSPGDSVLLFDISTRRVSVFSPEGEYVGQVDLAQQGFMAPTGRLDDGTIVAMGFSFNPSDMPAKGTVYRNPLPILLVAPSGGVPDTMAKFEGMEVYSEELSFGGRTFPTPMAVQFGRNTTVAASGDRIYVGDNGKPEIAVYGREGNLLKIIRTAYTPVRVTEEARQAQQEENLGQITRTPGIPPAMLGQAEDMIRRAKYAEAMPPYQTLVVARNGILWVQEYGQPGGPLRFSIHDTTGARIARTWLPARFRVMDIGPDYVLGLWRDENDLEHVRLYRTQVTASN